MKYHSSVQNSLFTLQPLKMLIEFKKKLINKMFVAAKVLCRKTKILKYLFKLIEEFESDKWRQVRWVRKIKE